MYRPDQMPDVKENATSSKNTLPEPIGDIFEFCKELLASLLSP